MGVVDLTVVVPAFGARETIQRTIASVLEQPVATDIVVVVDGDQDGTAALVRDCYRDRVTLIVNPTNRGAPFCRNLGLHRAATEAVLFLDADDYVTGSLFAGLTEALASGHADLALGPWRRFITAEDRYGPLHQPDYRSPDDLFGQWLAKERFVPPCSVMWRTGFLKSIGGWDEAIRRNQDGELVLRAMTAGAVFALSNGGAGIWVKHPHANSTSSRPDLIADMLVVPEKLVTLVARSANPESKLLALAEHFYNIALHSFKRGLPDVGEAAFLRSRALGYRKHKVRRLSALVIGLIGPRRFFAVRSFLYRRFRGIRQNGPVS